VKGLEAVRNVDQRGGQRDVYWMIDKLTHQHLRSICGRFENNWPFFLNKLFSKLSDMLIFRNIILNIG
jgi:hypothetical protein